MSQYTMYTAHRGDTVQDLKEGQCGQSLEWEGDEAGEVGRALWAMALPFRWGNRWFRS